MKTYKQQIFDAKSARLGITGQKAVSPNSRAKRRPVMLRAFLPAMLGWPKARQPITVTDQGVLQAMFADAV